MSTATSNGNNSSLIVEIPRGPSIAGTRITVYSVMDLIKANWSKERILQHMPITAEQLDAVYDYIAQHKAEVERDYARILQSSEELRAHYEQIFRERSPFPPEMPWEEQKKLMLQKAAEMKAARDPDEKHPPA